MDWMHIAEAVVLGGFGLWKRHQAAKAAAAHAAEERRRRELELAVDAIADRGEGIAELLERVKQYDELWRPRPPAKP